MIFALFILWRNTRDPLDVAYVDISVVVYLMLAVMWR